jgi:hypothetical protein
MSDAASPRVGSIRSVQVPGAHIQLAKVVENRMHEGVPFTLVCWIDVRRDAEWVPSFTIPPERE